MTMDEEELYDADDDPYALGLMACCAAAASSYSGLRPFPRRGRGARDPPAVPDAGRAVHLGETKLVALAELLQVAPSTVMRMVDRLIVAGLADRKANPANRRETLLRPIAEGRRTVEEVTARRRADIAAIVERLRPTERLALVEVLNAFNEAGGEPLAPAADDPEPHSLGWTVDGAMEHDA
ncbi:DNA-binding MarR family transcriptional regulator [Streptomyces griseochromogenes]|uniref:DNA-binding MarR family transcriptional regulator n=1 Tax=Streptomyces griseochromogenes TaxID=68214 RepID=A0ABS4M7R5_9ACTN|nr:DNA-binding MarR family transcriptional regulator [Streptomyces griseochromogenes]